MEPMSNSGDFQFKIWLYNSRFEPLISLLWGNKLPGRTANRVLSELYGERMAEFSEPWFELHPIASDAAFVRAEKPEGMTSLSGGRFSPDPYWSDKLYLHPQSKIKRLTLKVHNLNQLLFEGQFGVEDMFRAGVEYVMQYLFEKGRLISADLPIYYDLVQGDDAALNAKVKITLSIPPLPRVSLKSENVFDLPEREKGQERIRFTKVAVAPIPDAPMERFSQTQKMGRGMDRRGRVVLHPDIYEKLIRGIPLSHTAENGGYLLGYVFCQEGSPSDESHPDFKWILEITDVFKSDQTQGNAALLLFTHDSWSDIKRKIDEDHPDKKLVSWFHTHLFAATDDFGLSGLDQQLHAQFFSKSWQVALLLNINLKGERELRCFQLNEARNRLVESTYEILEIANTQADGK